MTVQYAIFFDERMGDERYDSFDTALTALKDLVEFETLVEGAKIEKKVDTFTNAHVAVDYVRYELNRNGKRLQLEVGRTS